MQINVTLEVWRKTNLFVAKCPELDFISQGATREEAKKNLLEVIEIQFEEMATMGTLADYLAECGYDKRNGKISQYTEMIGFEKYAVQVA
jgi:predicted RNase H-like HicB family nuclease